MKRRLQYVALFLLLAAGVSLRLAAKEPDWIEVRSEHFEIYSAANESKARQVLEHLERVHRAYERLTGAKLPIGKRVRVLLFRGEAEYREYAPDRFSLAYYRGARDRDYIVLSDFDSRTESVLNHEYFHLFSRHARFRFPVWLEEGLADVYSTLKITGRELSYGYPIAAHLRYLNESGSRAPLSQIFAVDRENRNTADRDATTRLYAQGWALAHMTFLGAEMRERSDRFLSMVRDGSTDVLTAYRTVYGLDAPRLDERLSGYIRQRSFPFGRVPAQGMDTRAPTEVVSLEPWEAPLLLADLLAVTGNREGAKARYDGIAARFPLNSEVEESRANLALEAGDRKAALPYLREAARRKSRNSMVYLHLAELACDYSSANPDCKAWIDEALRLDPSNRQARDWAVGYLLNIRDFQGAITALRAVGKVDAAGAPEFFHKLSYAHYQLRQFEEAHAAVRRGLSYAGKPEEIARLSEMERHIAEAEHGEAGAGPPSSGHVRQGVPEDIAASDADRAIEAFLELEGASITAAVLDSMDCSGAHPVALMKAKGAPLRLVIDRPNELVVIRGGAVIQDHEFACGKQAPATVFAGYLREGAPEGSDGLLRILSFQ